MVARHTQINLWYFLFALLAVIWIRDLWIASRSVEQISYSEFQQALEDGRIQEVEISSNRLQGTYREADQQGAKQFSTPRVDPRDCLNSRRDNGFDSD